jgi:hypothetical protein
VWFGSATAARLLVGQSVSIGIFRMYTTVVTTIHIPSLLLYFVFLTLSNAQGKIHVGLIILYEIYF